MRANTLRLPSVLAASWLFALPAAAPASPEDTAAALAAAAGVRTGVCAIPVAGDGALAAAFARKGFVVWASAPDSGKAASLRASLAGSGLLGRSLYLDTSKAGRIALADRSADLVVITPASPADLQTLPAAEVLRVLAPGNGIALVGPISAATEPAVRVWANGLPGATVREAAGARFLLARRGPLEGGSPWPHWFGGADNNPVSADTAFDGPVDVAWLGKPYHYPRKVGGRVAANGRVFIAIGASDNPNTPAAAGTKQVVARSMFNGTLLWRRPLGDMQRVLQSGMIADGDILRLVEGPDILVLDAATGGEKARVAAGKEGEWCKWIAQSDGILAALVGPEDPKDTGGPGDGGNMLKWKTERTLGYGQRIVAFDLKSGKTLWEHEEPNPVAGHAIAARDGKLFFFVPGQRLACIDMKTGEPVWENKDAAMLAGNEERVKDIGGVTVVAIEQRPSLLVTGDAVYLGQADAQNFYCFSIKDGTQLWTAKRSGGRAFNFLVKDGRLYMNGSDPGGVLDALTGEKAATQVNFGGGCGVFTASANAMMGQVGGASFPASGKKDMGTMPIKTQCQLGTFVADGSMIAVPAACRCVVGRGFIALAKASEKPAQAEPLETFVPDLTKTVPLAVTANDWPTHRGNNERTGSSPVNAPAAAPKELWAWNNPAPLVVAADQGVVPAPEAPDFKPLPPVAAGGLIFLAAEDGSLRCLDGGSGSLKWTAWTDGPIFAAPSVADGRLFIGSADGRVYAFEAATGKPLWRYTAAPSTDRMMGFGHLQSRWPVNSGVLVQGGTAYAAAGMLLQPGLSVVALDAATGAPKWRNDEGAWKEGAVWQMPSEIFAAGYMTVFGGNLWLRSFQGGGGGAAFDLATGALQDKVPVGGLRGREIGAIKDRALVYGGRDIYIDRAERTMGRGGLFALLPFGPDGKAVVPDMGNFDSSGLTPAWNDTLFLTAGTQFAVNDGDINLECWDIDKALACAAEKAAAAGFDALPTWRKNQFPEPRPPADINNPTFRLWGPVKSLFASVLIAGKTAISVSTPVDHPGQIPSGEWKLAARDLQDGTVLWEIGLPAQPARDGLCIDRNGRVLVSFDDGSVRCYGL